MGLFKSKAEKIHEYLWLTYLTQARSLIELNEWQNVEVTKKRLAQIHTTALRKAQYYTDQKYGVLVDTEPLSEAFFRRLWEMYEV